MNDCDISGPWCFHAAGYSERHEAAFLQFRRDGTWYRYPCSHLEFRFWRYGGTAFGCVFNSGLVRPLPPQGVQVAAPPAGLIDIL